MQTWRQTSKNYCLIFWKEFIIIAKPLLSALKNYQKKQQLYQKLYGKKYNYHHIEDVVNEYGKAVEKRIVINDNIKRYKEKIKQDIHLKLFIMNQELKNVDSMI